MFRRDHDLIEIHRLWIDRDETGKRAILLCEHDMRGRHQLSAPALTPPWNTCIKIKMRIMFCPSAPPQLDRRVFVGGGVSAQRADLLAHRSVSLNSMRRLRL